MFIYANDNNMVATERVAATAKNCFPVAPLERFSLSGCVGGGDTGFVALPSKAGPVV